jgi:hypothetical protein
MTVHDDDESLFQLRSFMVIREYGQPPSEHEVEELVPGI